MDDVLQRVEKVLVDGGDGEANADDVEESRPEDLRGLFCEEEADSYGDHEA